MDEDDECRRWDDAIPDVLAEIFCKLPFRKRLSDIPIVCKSWRRAVAHPSCWEDMDIYDACWKRADPEFTGQILQMLVPRSCGSLHSLRVAYVDDRNFNYIADIGRSLQSLDMQWSTVSDDAVEQAAPKLSKLTSLDLSFCYNIGASSLCTFGMNCPFLTRLRRRMSPGRWASPDDEAHAIAAWMPRLRHLEISHRLLTENDLLAIVSSCRDLEFLNIRGCADMNLDQALMRENYPGLTIECDPPPPLTDSSAGYWSDDDDLCLDANISDDYRERRR